MDSQIAVTAKLELLIEVGAFGFGAEERRVFLVGHIEIPINLAGLTRLQFQHPFLGSVADAGNASDSTGTLCNL